MSDEQPSRDPAWYQERWNELTTLLSASDPAAVLDLMRSVQDVQERLGADTAAEAADALSDLQARARRFDEQQAVLREAGFDRPELALETIRSMEAQLDELYDEKTATEQTDAGAALDEEADTFDQLQALLAREEKLQRELGVSSPDAVVEMVEGLSEQLEDVYQDRDETQSDSIFDPAPDPDAASDRDASRDQPEDASLDRLETEFGVSDPDAVAQMLRDLTDQLDDLYAGRERLAELNLNGADDAIAMVRSMQEQLESLYERQEEMSAHGVDSIDHALSMIENMEAQLDELYEERRTSAEQNGVPSLDEATDRLQALEDKLETLTEEKTRLRETHSQLQAKLDDLEDELGTDDPDTITSLVRSMEEQLEDVYEQREAAPAAPPEPSPLLPDDTLAQLNDRAPEALDDLSVGAFFLDDQNRVRRANEAALQWPDLTADTPDALEGRAFFDEIAPAANNALFRGRIEEGRTAGTLDEQFLYTYVGQTDPLTTLSVRLYRPADHSGVWIVFEIRDRY
jgi:photoactive yellow protein